MYFFLCFFFLRDPIPDPVRWSDPMIWSNDPIRDPIRWSNLWSDPGFVDTARKYTIISVKRRPIVRRYIH